MNSTPSGKPDVNRPDSTKHGSKLAFADFVPQLDAAMDTGPKRDGVGTVLKLLKVGFQEDVTSDHIQTVLDRLNEYRSVDRLAVRLASNMPKRPNQLLRALRNRLRTQFSQEVCYPQEGGAISRQDDRLDALTSWMSTQQLRVQSEGRGSASFESWVRRVFVCVCGERDQQVRDPAVQHLLVQVARTNRRTARHVSDSQSFLREVGKLISAPKISAPRVVASLQFGQPFVQQLDANRATVEDVSERLTEERHKCEQYAQANESLDRQLQEARGKLTRLTRELQDARDEIEFQKRRLEESEAHWTHTSRQQLARQRYTMTEQMKHDLQEARLCLDRDCPNVGMALGRIKRLEDLIRKTDSPS